MHLNRIELLEKLGELEFFPEFRKELNYYLQQYIQSKDLEVVKPLLEAGADPNPKEPLDCHLDYLLHEYQVTKTTAGVTVLKLLKLLLEFGANPNRVVLNNQRAYDHSVSKKLPEIEKLLLKHGATKELREWI